MNSNNDNMVSEIQTNCFAASKLTKRIPHTGFIIYEMMNDSQSINILQTSAAKQSAVIKFETRASETVPNNVENVVKINGEIYSTIPVTTNKKEAKTQAFDKALEYARKIHYTIKVGRCSVVEFEFSSFVFFFFFSAKSDSYAQC